MALILFEIRARLAIREGAMKPRISGLLAIAAHLSRDPKKNFFLAVIYLTLLDRFLNDDA
jgi:hypothetical protein